MRVCGVRRICELDQAASSWDWNVPANEPQYVRVNWIWSKLPGKESTNNQ